MLDFDAFSPLLAPRMRKYHGGMKLQEEEIREYMEIYKRDFGEDLTFEEAREITVRLIALYEVLCRPPTKDVEQQCKTNYLEV
jgi:hypothetical protein